MGRWTRDARRPDPYGRPVELDPHVRETDAFALRMEADPLLRSTIVAVALLDRAPDQDVLVARLERATRLAPGFREVLVDPPLRLAPPRWVPDAAFDLGWHVRRVAAPAPYGFEQVLQLARTAGMAAFDPARPRWELTVVEGLEGGRAALVVKVHHALTDGIGGLQIAEHLVDLERDAAPPEPAPHRPSPRPPSGLGLLRDAVEHDLRRLGHDVVDRVRALPGLVREAVLDPVGSARGVLEDLRSVGRFAEPVTRTLSPVMTERRRSWHYAVLDVPFAHLHEGSHAAGGTLNDGFLAAVTGGLQRYHHRHGAHVHELRLTMPISVRRPEDPIGGNRITLARFTVPAGIADPARRVQAIDAQCRRMQREPAIPYSDVIAGALNLLPRSVTAGMLKHVDFLASDVPGFPEPVYVAGSRVEAFYALGPTIGAAANVTLMSYAGTCHLGITVDEGAVPDPEALVECLVEGIDEVRALAGHAPAPPAA